VGRVHDGYPCFLWFADLVCARAVPVVVVNQHTAIEGEKPGWTQAIIKVDDVFRIDQFSPGLLTRA
jgi:hypothetical protein